MLRTRETLVPRSAPGPPWCPVRVPAIVLNGVTPFETLLHAETAPLTRRLLRLLGDPDAAEDLRQETLARAWRVASRDWPAERLRGWLHRTATNLALDELRRRRRRAELPLEEAFAPAGPAEPETVGGDARTALAALSPHQRLLLLLRHEAGSRCGRSARCSTSPRKRPASG